ncbi:MAG: hypothetical protein R2911_14855 [Caldilineaceae bacterium]
MASGDLLKQLFRNYADHNTPGFGRGATDHCREAPKESPCASERSAADPGQWPRAPFPVGWCRGWQNGRFHPLPRNSEEESGLLEIANRTAVGPI